MSTLSCGVSNYVNGIVSTVTRGTPPTYNRAAVTQLPPLTPISGDPRVLPFKDNNGDDRVLVASYVYPTPPSVGTADFGIYVPNATTGWGSPITTKTSVQWGVSNPYGLVTLGDLLYVQDYDANNIAVIQMTSNDPLDPTSTDPTKIYNRIDLIEDVFEPEEDYTAHGNGLSVYDYDDDGFVTVLVAVYSQEQNYTYEKSALVLIDITNPPTYTKRTLPGLTENAVSVTVQAVEDAPFAYVCAIGGSQVAGGSAASALEVITLPVTNLGTPALAHTINATTTPSAFGDFVDLEFWDGGFAYLLASNFDSLYSEYTYQLIRTDPAASLNTGVLTPASSTATTSPNGPLISSPAGATWLLAPAIDTLWLVAGNNVYNVPGSTLSGSATPFGAVVANATDGTSSGPGLGTTAINGNINTAGVVIDLPPITTRSGAKVSASRTKVTLSAEELKRRRKK
jgi:hypothetical protein